MDINKNIPQLLRDIAFILDSISRLSLSTEYYHITRFNLWKLRDMVENLLGSINDILDSY